MPFDTESFLKGYMTGLNLSRAPGGHGRKPDVPNGIYILAEDGTPIITELFSSSDVSITPIGEWYVAVGGEYPYKRIVWRDYTPPHTDVYIVWATPTISSSGTGANWGAALICEQDWHYSISLSIEGKKTEDGAISRLGSWYAVLPQHISNGYRFGCVASGGSVTYELGINAYPADIVTLDADTRSSETLTGDVMDFLNSLASIKIITE